MIQSPVLSSARTNVVDVRKIFPTSILMTAIFFHVDVIGLNMLTTCPSPLHLRPRIILDVERNIVQWTLPPVSQTFHFLDVEGRGDIVLLQCPQNLKRLGRPTRVNSRSLNLQRPSSTQRYNMLHRCLRYNPPHLLPLRQVVKRSQKKKHITPEHASSLSASESHTSPSSTNDELSSSDEDSLDHTQRHEPVVMDDQPHSPSEDFRAYSQLILRLAKALKLSVVQPEPNDSDSIYEDIATEHLPPAQLTYVKSLLKLIKQSWAKPSAMTQMPRRMEALYKIAGVDIDFLTDQPPLIRLWSNPPNSNLVYDLMRPL